MTEVGSLQTKPLDHNGYSNCGGTIRLGRKTRIGSKQREELWTIFAALREELKKRSLVAWSRIFGRLSESLAGKKPPLFEFIVADEA